MPDDVDSTDVVKASALVVLPTRVCWSGPPRTWDLDDRRDRLQVYEMVLAEGTDDDVRRFIDVDQLIELWPDLLLPGHVRAAWAEHLRGLRGVTLTC